MKTRILFLCIHNSARSQMAEAYMNRICPEFFEAQSAGLEPGKLNPMVVQVLAEDGIDIAGKETRDVWDVTRSGTLFSHVVTVCDEASAQRCPIFPGHGRKLHWNFPDPTGRPIEEVRELRDSIKARVEAFCAEQCVATAA